MRNWHNKDRLYMFIKFMRNKTPIENRFTFVRWLMPSSACTTMPHKPHPLGPGCILKSVCMYIATFHRPNASWVWGRCHLKQTETRIPTLQWQASGFSIHVFERMHIKKTATLWIKIALLSNELLYNAFWCVVYLTASPPQFKNIKAI